MSTETDHKSREIFEKRIQETEIDSVIIGSKGLIYPELIFC